MSNTEQIEYEITKALSAANGRRRERTLTMADVAQALRESLIDDPSAGYGFGYVNGGTVANAYGYPAFQTKIVATRRRREIRLRIFQDRANKGSGTGLPFNRNATDATAREAIDARHSNPIVAFGQIRLTTRDARRLIERYEIASDPVGVDTGLDLDAVISVEASLAAGNCERETARVREWVGKDTATVREVVEAIRAHNADHLIRYVGRIVTTVTA